MQQPGSPGPHLPMVGLSNCSSPKAVISAFLLAMGSMSWPLLVESSWFSCMLVERLWPPCEGGTGGGGSVGLCVELSPVQAC